MSAKSILASQQIPNDGRTIQRFPLTGGSYGAQLVAKVEVPTLVAQRQPLSLDNNSLNLYKPTTDVETLKKIAHPDENTRTTWRLDDITTNTQYTGVPDVPNDTNRFYLIYHPTPDQYHAMHVDQLHLRRVNTNARFVTLGEADDYKKRTQQRATKAADAFSSQFDITEQTKAIINQTKKRGGKIKREGAEWGHHTELEWGHFDDDEGAQNAELEDLDDTGDWKKKIEKKKQKYVDSDHDSDDEAMVADQLNAQWVNNENVMTDDDDESSDSDDDQMLPQQPALLAPAAALGVVPTVQGKSTNKRKNAPAIGPNDMFDDNVTHKVKKTKHKD